MAALRQNPLYRALRVDKMTLAALDVVLADHDSGRATQRVPVLRMLAASESELRSRAEALAAALREAQGGFAVETCPRRVGRGWRCGADAGPAHDTRGRLRPAARTRRPGRGAACGDPPVIVAIADGRVVL